MPVRLSAEIAVILGSHYKHSSASSIDTAKTDSDQWTICSYTDNLSHRIRNPCNIAHSPLISSGFCDNLFP
jgi:hypothetical protein